jgi:hypothetical protein
LGKQAATTAAGEGNNEKQEEPTELNDESAN